MRGILWTILFVMLAVWLAAFLLDIGGSSIRALLAIVIIVLGIFVITGRTSPEKRE